MTSRSPGTPHDTDGVFNVQGGNGTPNSRWRGLLKFDLSSIPPGMTVTGARLRLGTLTGFSYDGDINHHALVVPDGWNEASVTWNTKPADGIGTTPCAFAATGCDDAAAILTPTNPNYLGKDDVFYGGPYGTFLHIHTIPRPPETGVLVTRLAQRVQAEHSEDNTLSIEIINPCCGPPDEGYWARYASSEYDNANLRPALVLTLEAGGGGGDLVVTNNANAGAGSLRQAILDANAQAGEQTISFNITVPEVGPKVIALQSSLPDITGPVTIDGTTQPGYVVAPNAPPVIVLDGGAAGVLGNGLTVAAGGGGTVIRALSITNFNPSPAAAIDAGAADVVVDRSYIGVRPNGTTVGANGVGIRVGGSDALVGATGIGAGNLIVASQGPGVELEGNDARVIGNVIAAVTGVAGSGNGVGVFNDGAQGSVIEANGITSATTGDGVVIGGASAGVDILNNGISGNAGLGIDTRDDGVTENDPEGPVDHENFPTVVSATSNGANLNIVVEFLARDRPAGQSYRLELFRNTACDASGNGEGELRLGGAANVTTNAAGFASHTFVVPGATTGALTATATPMAGNRSTSEFSECLEVGGGGGSVVLDAVQATVPSTGEVPLARIPGSALVARPPGLQASPIRDIPIRDIPIADIPIADIPIADIPIADIGFTDQFVLPLLATFSLADMPLLRPGGWPTALVGTAFAAAPTQNLSLRDVLALPLQPAAFLPPNQLTLADLDLSRTPLGRVPAVAVVLGTGPNVQLSDLDGTADWCQLVGPGINCSPSSSVLAISIQGAPIADIPIADIPIADIPIADIPIADIPIADIPIADIPIADIPIADIPIADIPIADITLLLDCTGNRCAGKTLYDAFVGEWFRPGVTLGQLLLAVQRLQTDHGVTLADVLVLLFSSTASIGWEQLDLDTAGLQAAAGEPNHVDWNADVRITGPTTTATVVLPRRFIFDPSVTPTVRDLPAGTAVPLPAPEIGSDQQGNVTLEWELTGTIGTQRRIAFRTFPPFRVGALAGVLISTGGGPATTSAPAPIAVTETFEPNGTAGGAEPVSTDALYLSYVTNADDLDFYSFPAPPVGSTIRVFLSHLPADYDLALYSPTDAQLRPDVTGNEQLDSPPLVDEGVPLTTRQEALPPETLDDLRIDPTRPLVGVSANRGTEDDAVVAISGGGTGNYLIQVTPYNGATSVEPYMIRVEIEPPPLNLTAAALPAPSGTAGTVPASVPAGTNTLFLWNRRQLTAQYGAGAAGDVLAAMQQTQTQLTALGFPSAIVGVDGSTAVASAFTAWNADPGDPNKANAVVRAINAVVDNLRTGPNGAGIKYLVLVGGDRAIPFGRLEDYVTIANESGYAQSVGAGNELSAALGAGRILSDDPYADTSPARYLNRQFFVPDLSVGRLVETPAEIVAALARYRSFNGRLDPSTGTVFGYDFLSDGATDVRSELNARPGLNVPAGSTFINEQWTQANLIGALLPATPPSIASLNGHADHFRLQRRQRPAR